MATVSWLAFRSTFSEGSSQCWTRLRSWPITCGDPTTSLTRWPASIGCASLRESCSRSLYWQCRPRTCADVPRPFHTCRRPTQSTIAAFCGHQSPGSAYQQTVDCWQPSFTGYRPADMEWPPRKTWHQQNIGHISSPPQDTSVRKSFPDY